MTENTIQGNNTPIKRTNQQFGESRPQPPTTPEPSSVTVTQKNQSTTPKTSQSSEPGPIPQDPTARLDPSLDLTHVPRLFSEENQQY